MKKIALFMLIAGACITQSVDAQINVSVNIGSQPLWGPTGYDYVDYYYLPEYDMYYDVPNRRYIYWQDNRRIITTTLPARYRQVDFYKTYKVVLNEKYAYRNHERDRRQYAEYKGRHDQSYIRDSHEEKYWKVKGHPDHGKWKANGHDNGRRGHH